MPAPPASCGVALVTSGPGATNMVTPLTDALMDSIPMVCITGQVADPPHRLGRLPGSATRSASPAPCTKHNWLVKDVNDLARIIHEAFYVATHGRPGPVVVDIPKDVQFATGVYIGPRSDRPQTYHPRTKGDRRDRGRPSS